MNTLSFGGRFAVIAVLSTVLTVALLATTAYRELVADFESVLTQRQQLEAQAYASRVNQRLQLRLDALGALASQLTDGEQLRPGPELDRIIRRQDTIAGYFDIGIVVFDHNSIAIAEDRHVPGRLGTFYGDRAHFQRAIATGQPHISRPIIGRTTGAVLLSFLYPIRNDQGDFLGLVTGGIDLHKTSLLPEPGKLYSDAVFKVLDTLHFTRVDQVEPDNLLPPLPDPGESALIDAALSGITSGVVTDEDGQRWIYATRHLERVGWLFLRAVPYGRATAPAQASFTKFIAISLALLGIMTILVLIAARAASRPLEQMAARMRDMSDHTEDTARLKETGAPEIRSVARAFNRLMDEREAVDELKSQFLANVSHELRTPLTSINGSLKLLAAGKAGELPGNAEKLVSVALRNSEQLQRLITDLLDFNKAIAGQLAMAPEPVNVRDALEQACRNNRSYAQSHHVALELGDVPELRVTADPHRLRQILDNFISNACKFAPNGSRVTLRAKPAVDGLVRIIVSDRGKGVPDHFRPKLFQRFAQAEASTARAKAGTGLGLAICRELATLMQGEVGYYYRDGAHFWVALPVCNPALPEQATP